jgi:hypothetical protein
MKTKLLVKALLLSTMVYVFTTCSKEGYPMPSPDGKSPIIVPSILINDTIFTNFYTPGELDLSFYINWGGEIGTLSISSASNGIALDPNRSSKRPLLLWDNTLSLGTYPIRVEAENSAGKVEHTLLLKTLFGGYFIKMRNEDPNSLEGLIEEPPLIFDFDGLVHSCICIDPEWGVEDNPPGQWEWVSENEIKGTYYSDENYPDATTNYHRAFRSTITYDSVTGHPRLTGVWYQDDVVNPGSEKGSIVLSLDISAWEYFHGN